MTTAPFTTLLPRWKEWQGMVKRFPVKGVTKDKEYTITKGKPDSKVLYFSANPNGEESHSH